MSKPSKSASSSVSPISGTVFLFARLLLAAAIGLSAYLAWTSLSGQAVAGCGADEPCNEVLGSRWAYWFGLPVSLLGLPVYITLFAASFMLDPRMALAFRQRAWQIILGGMLLTISGAGWFTGLQLVAIKAFCPYCLATHVCAAIGAWLLWSQRPTNQKLGPDSWLSATQHNGAVIAAFTALAVLAVGQIVAPKKTNVVTAIPTTSTANPTNTPAISTQAVATATTTNTTTPVAAPTVQASARTSDRKLPLHDGRFTLEFARVPVRGPVNAPHVLVSMFDYTCNHCRDMHGLLHEVSQTFSNELVILSLPMPLSADCNRLLRGTGAPHINACYYARLALAVYLAAPEKFPQFDDWLFQPDKPPATMQAKEFAEQLVGKDALMVALMNPQVETLLQQSINLYEANYQQIKNSKMPQLILAGRISAGAIARVEDLYQLLDDSFGLKRK